MQCLVGEVRRHRSQAIFKPQAHLEAQKCMNLLQNVYDLSSRITGGDSADTSIAEALHNAMTIFECHECRNSNIMTEAQLEEAAEKSFALWLLRYHSAGCCCKVGGALVWHSGLHCEKAGFCVLLLSLQHTSILAHTHTTVNSRAKTYKCFRKAFQNLQHPSVRS